mgnify:CR=1 FL=1
MVWWTVTAAVRRDVLPGRAGDQLRRPASHCRVDWREALLLGAARCLAAPTLRVWTHVFSDWRVLVDGGKANGGRDEPLLVRAEAAAGSEAPAGAVAYSRRGCARNWFAVGCGKHWVKKPETLR